jgi:hypothetical protein
MTVPLVAIPVALYEAYHRLYDTYWNRVATVEIDEPGYNGLSYDDTVALDDAASAIEDLLAKDKP